MTRPDETHGARLVGGHLSSCVAQFTHNTVVANDLWQSLQCANVSNNAQIYLLNKTTPVTQLTTLNQKHIITQPDSNYLLSGCVLQTVLTFSIFYQF